MVACQAYNLCDSEKWYWTWFCLIQYDISSSHKLYIRLIIIQYLFNIILGNIILLLSYIVILYLRQPILILNVTKYGEWL